MRLDLVRMTDNFTDSDPPVSLEMGGSICSEIVS